MKSLSFAAILVTVCAVAACSDEGGPEGDGGAGGGGGASGTTTSSSSSTVTTGTGTGGSGEGGGGGGGGGGSADCAAQCFEDNQQGAVAFLELTLEACGCAEGATCVSSCDTTEAETDACGDDGSANLQGLRGNEACLNCVDGLREDECLDTFAGQCAADEGCAAYITCVSECL
ncbi:MULTISPECIES: hypothetical protein [Sorangium]|uniref:Secreted protein n=1 Tax=Sorangium cellulosum TaxID=56 RepID=A0A4P2QNZ0_SORCE|nr:MULTISPECIES: hypothetical protein [Sorangium]AUX31213.1 hypothetical protein SOCE836_033420 [Sorangium cellulosum]WCQ90597.1 hypothetical protein NQZ70_03308 [Sorangium sp. Soce836]